MSSWIGVYGRNQTVLDWMRENYQRADQSFKQRHPVLESGGERFEHGILVRGDSRNRDLRFQYYWELPCHWDSDKHFKQTEADIKAVLKELGRPKGIEVYLSPHAD